MADQNYTCLDTGSWDNDVNDLFSCKWTHCYNATEAPPENLLTVRRYGEVDVYNDTMVLIGDEVDYFCDNGRRFEDDLHLDKQSSTCKVENEWEDPPLWGTCIESE